MLPDGQVATDDLCGDHDACVQAIDSTTAVIRKYSTQADAEAAAAELGDDGYLSGWIVVKYKAGGLSATEQGWLEQGIDGTNVDSPD